MLDSDAQRAGNHFGTKEWKCILHKTKRKIKWNNHNWDCFVVVSAIIELIVGESVEKFLFLGFCGLRTVAKGVWWEISHDISSA